MKRSKQRSSGSGRQTGREDDPAPWAKPEAPEATWSDVVSKGDEAFVPFSMSARYSKGDFIAHPKFGKGIVVGVEASRIEVLFEGGKKKLGHGVQ